MARKKKHPEHVNHERWLISYADFITLLFAFFVVMFAVSQVDSKKVGRFQDSFSLAIGIAADERGYLPRVETEAKPLSASMVPLRNLPEPGQADGGESGSLPRFPEDLAALEEALNERKALEQTLAGLKIVRRGNDLVLRLDATALFDSGDDRVREESKPMLFAVAEEVRTRKVQIRVEGHTDDQPIRTLRYRSNWDLSTARATSVVNELVEKGAIEPLRLAAVGYAEFQPIGDNKTTAGRQANRRVDIVLSVMPERPNPNGPAPASGEFAPAPPAAESQPSTGTSAAPTPTPAPQPADAPPAKQESPGESRGAASPPPIVPAGFPE
jgi:chemotaxis protein MotB